MGVRPQRRGALGALLTEVKGGYLPEFNCSLEPVSAPSPATSAVRSRCVMGEPTFEVNVVCLVVSRRVGWEWGPRHWPFGLGMVRVLGAVGGM